MVTEEERRSIADEEQLKMLPVFYWVLGALDVLFSSYGLFYIVYGLIFGVIAAQPSVSSEEVPVFIAWLFSGIGAAITLWFLANAVLKVLVGFWIRKRRRYIGCLITAGLTCLSMPFGTIIGVFTFIVLLRPSVAALFKSAGGSGDVPSADVLPIPQILPAPPQERA